MRLFRTAAAAAALLASSSAQLITSQEGNGLKLTVNIPASTASGSSQTIFFQMQAPSGTKWAAFGQGTGMSGSNIFVMYADGSGNVTVSPRLGKGHVEPNYNSAAQISVLDGSGVQSDGSLIANVRCDTCLSWSGGSMQATDSSSNWIWGQKSGSALNSKSLSANIVQHDESASFQVDLTQGTGGSSSNPFVGQASSPSSSAGSAQSSASGSTPSSTSGSNQYTTASSSTPTSTSSYGSTSGSSSSSTNPDAARRAHGIIMSLVFLVFLPLGALTVYLPFGKKILFVHAPLQLLSLVLLMVGLALGVIVRHDIGIPNAYHQIIGYAVVALLVIAQPLLGAMQHIHFRRTGGRSPMGVVHAWLGRTVIVLGVINGGLGMLQTRLVGSEYVPNWVVVAYSIVAAVVLLIYLAITLGSRMRGRSQTPVEKRDLRGYEMHPSTSNYRGQQREAYYR